MTVARSISAVSTIRAIILIAAAGLLIWISVGVTLTLATAKENPERALAWWPWGAASQAALANRLAADPKAGPAELERAAMLAHSALRREPVNVDAARTLALIAARQKNGGEADKWFAITERLSRRDLTTQLWMIEKAVRDGNIRLALRHYDRALRTSRRAPDLLLPTLVAASDDPQIAKPLTELLSTRPAWWKQFLALAVKEVKSSNVLVEFGQRIRLNPDDAEEAGFAVQILGRLIRDGRYTQAFDYYSTIRGRAPSAPALLRDGGFDRNSIALPFEWSLHDELNLSATRELFGPGDTRLVLRASGGRGGEIARQILVLPPGRYTLSGRAADTGGSRLSQPTLEVRCMESRELSSTALPAAGVNAVDFRFPFVIPASGCRAQSLIIKTAPAVTTEAWIDGLSIRRD